MATAGTQRAYDHLCLANNQSVQKLLAKQKGQEKVCFSDFVIKINKRGRQQTRTLLITDQAIYNLTVKTYKLKRRIEVGSVGGMTVSHTSDEFVLHIPEEYDYRYISSKKGQIRDVLKSIRGKAMGFTLTDASALEEATTTKAQARSMSRDERASRKAELAAQTHDSDNEDRTEAEEAGGGDKFHSMMASSKNKIKLADFELLKVLGRGAFGKVMQVKMKSDGAVYAMKILKKDAIAAKNQVEHTRAERSILEQLDHPFLMKLRYAFQSKDKLYFVLDYFQGGELFFHLKAQRRFSEDVARLYVAEIALAFGHLHSLGVIYRDLKPENILLDDQGHVCLTDFGLAKEMEEGKQAHTFCGTPEYLAPEIVQGLGHNKAVDWWSLGILLYELTVGIPPFYAQNVNEMYNKIQHGVLRFPPFLSEDCKQLVIGLLSRDPKKRLGSTQDVEDVKTMAFFTSQPDWSWDRVFAKQMEAPFKPKIGGVDDTSNFDEEFLKEPVVDSMADAATMSGFGAADFQGFTYKGHKPGEGALSKRLQGVTIS